MIDTPDLLEGGGSHETFLMYPETVKGSSHYFPHMIKPGDIYVVAY